MLLHAVWRSVALIFLGIFLRSMNSAQTNWTFEDTLTQIGLGYTFLFLLAFTSLRVQIAAFVAILVGFWAAFVLYPLPAEGFDYTQVGVRADWPHLYSGFLAHFNKNSNLSWAFDVWFMNLFPRAKPFLYNGGGWSTLSFIPTLATMMLGLWAGRWLMTSRPHIEKLKGLAIAGVALTLAGLILQWLHINPIIKRIWTSSYTLVQRRPRHPDPGGLLCADRAERLEAVGVPVAGDRRELDRGLCHELDDRELRVVSAGEAPRDGPISGVGDTLRAGLARVRGAGGVLVDPAVDVSAQDLPAHLTSICRRFAVRPIWLNMRWSCEASADHPEHGTHDG